ncbi:MAG TPA: hypothetical protein H9769_07145 [Candidatus Microbacterium pullistercoris]|nr:hypothetical protein [Candidatus Microbacterium pullistercoris]
MTDSTFLGGTSPSHLDVSRDTVVTFPATVVAEAFVRQAAPSHLRDRRYGVGGRVYTYDTSLEH